MDNRRRLSFAALTGLAGLLALSGAFVIPQIATAGTPRAVTAAQSASQPAASSTAVPLPIAHYSHMLVDPAHQHLFITSGTGYSTILVTDYAGHTVATISNEPGATGLALSSDGNTVYAALAGADAVSAISTSTLTETARYPTGTTGIAPSYVAYTSGRIWFGYSGIHQGNAFEGGIGSIDPSTSPATVTLNAAPGSWYAAPMVTASPGGVLAAGDPTWYPAKLATYNVSSGAATVLAPEGNAGGSLAAFQITPDGKDMVEADHEEYFQRYRVSDLSRDGVYTAPNAASPGSVSISGDGMVAAGTSAANANAIFVFAQDGSTPLNTFSFGSTWLAIDGTALTPDGSELFAVTTAGPSGDSSTLNIIPAPAEDTVSVTNPGGQASTTGTPASLQIHAISSGGNALTYSATGLPPGLSIGSSGLISGTPTTAGTYSVNVTANDTTGASDSASFGWTVNPAPPPPTGVITGYAGLCLDDYGSGAANGTKVDLYTCNGTRAQRWVLHPTLGSNWPYTGELVSSNGKCVNDAGYGGAGSKVILWTCTGTSNEIWTYWTKYKEYAVSYGGNTYCMNDPGYSTAKGTQQIVWGCPDTANERYTLPH